MMNKKRAITLLLAAALMVGTIPVQGTGMNVKAEQTNSQSQTNSDAENGSQKCGDYAQWDFDENTGALTISGYGIMNDYFNEETPWTQYDQKITSVNIGENISKIGARAFQDCTNLETVNLNEGLDVIGYSAFQNCSSLRQIIIPASVTDILPYSFAYCSALGSIIIPEGVQTLYNNFMECTSLESVTIPDSVTDIREDVFGGHSDKLKLSVTKGSAAEKYAVDNCIDYSVTKPVNGKCGIYAQWSFDEATGELTVSGYSDMDSYNLNNAPWHAVSDEIKSVKIENGITSIGINAFINCKNLTSVEYADSVKQINDCAFSGCENLIDFKISDNVEYIGENVFGDCKLISQYENSVQYVDNWAVRADDPTITNVKLRENTVGIAANTFEEFTELKEAVLPDSLLYICQYAFSLCENLQNVKLPQNLKRIDQYAFYWCTDFTSVVIPDSVTGIDSYAFCGCSRLPQITLGTGLKSLGSAVFKDCINLTSASIPEGVEKIDVSAFDGCSRMVSVMLPASVTHIDETAFDGHSELMKIQGTKGSEAEKFAVDKNIVFIDAGSVSSEIIYGDLDSSGAVDMTDLTILSLNLIHEYTFSSYQEKAADVTGDGKKDIADLAMLKQYISMDDVVLGPQPNAQ